MGAFITTGNEPRHLSPWIRRLLTNILLLAAALGSQQVQADSDKIAELHEVRVWGQKSRALDRHSPTSLFTHEDIRSINVVTTEDFVKYEPSLVIRRRFIGDANGTLGLRGANMFQTSRSMVFADGVPLHYLLESRWNGAPRWTMVAASEIAQVEVIYGPFSAEYSGNAMGGVVLIETAIPQKREFHLDGTFFTQTFDAYGFDDNIDGYKGFVSYGDKVGDLSFYLAYNRLDNESQPQSFFFAAPSTAPNSTAVSGAIVGSDERGNTQFYFGDSGVIDTATDSVKFKLGYESGAWLSLLNIAYEDRNSISDNANSYIFDSAGRQLWGGNASQNEAFLFIPHSRLNTSGQDRHSLSIGLRIKGNLSDSASLETNFSHFDILSDETRTSARNPAHPDYDSSGQILDYDNSGWQTAEIKLRLSTLKIPTLGIKNLEFVSGFRHENYQLQRNLYHSTNYRAGDQTDLANSSGGETRINAVFSQLNWNINPYWQLSLGGRYEFWQSHKGYLLASGNDDSSLTFTNVPGRTLEKFSPKFSLRFQPNDRWTLSYAIAKAYRFPIIEELYSQYQAFNAISEANPNLNPENGLHHNVMLERAFTGGYGRVNLFWENVDDVIEAQSTTLPGGTGIFTFIPVDEVETRGAEIIADATDVFLARLDIRANLTWIDAEIIDNRVDPGIIGNQFPRMPKWRGNLMATYGVNDRVEVSANLQYASRSFGRLDNTDVVSSVFGSQDGYTRIGVKTSYQLTAHTKAGIGIDNLTNEIAYVAHPWPGRTLYLNFSYDI